MKLFEKLFTDDIHVKIVCLPVVVFTEHLLKYPVKVPQNCFNSFSCSNQIGKQILRLLFVLDK